MKLKNKRTGEVKEVIVGGYPVSGKTKMWECSEVDANEETGYKSLGTYTSLAELNEEWEDYDDTKDHWCISFHGEAKQIGSYADREEIAECKQIGNYFETKEEAELAVRKLKAWKRLKDKGFRFLPDASSIQQKNEEGKSIGSISFTMDNEDDYIWGNNEDLKILFGGEE